MYKYGPEIKLHKRKVLTVDEWPAPDENGLTEEFTFEQFKTMRVCKVRWIEQDTYGDLSSIRKISLANELETQPMMEFFDDEIDQDDVNIIKLESENLSCIKVRTDFQNDVFMSFHNKDGMIGDEMGSFDECVDTKEICQVIGKTEALVGCRIGYDENGVIASIQFKTLVLK